MAGCGLRFEWCIPTRVEDHSMARGVRVNDPRVCVDLLLCAGFSRAGVEMVNTRRGDRSRVVAPGLDRISCLPALFQLLQRDLRVTRRSDHPDALALLHG